MKLQEELDAVMRRKHDAREIRLLNVGSDHKGEYHWRFRTAAGEIATLRVALER